MTGFRKMVTTLSAVFITLVAVGTVPALAWSDRDAETQAPRSEDAQAPATLDDAQSPRGLTAATLDDAQAPRGVTAATLDDAQAPRGQETQAPRGQDTQAPRQEDEQAPRGSRG